MKNSIKLVSQSTADSICLGDDERAAGEHAGGCHVTRMNGETIISEAIYIVGSEPVTSGMTVTLIHELMHSCRGPGSNEIVSENAEDCCKYGKNCGD